MTQQALPPYDDRINFFRIRKGGPVHVFRDRYVRPVEGVEGLEHGDEIEPGVAFVLGRLRARCGHSGLEAKIWWWCWADTFSDDDLCYGCVAVTPDAERPLLFEHPTRGG